MDAYEGWDTATADIPGAFMQEKMVRNVNVRLEERLAGLMTKLGPNCTMSICTNEIVNLPCM